MLLLCVQTHFPLFILTPKLEPKIFTSNLFLQCFASFLFSGVNYPFGFLLLVVSDAHEASHGCLTQPPSGPFSVFGVVFRLLSAKSD